MKLEYEVRNLDLTYPFGISREISRFVTSVFVKLTYEENGKKYIGYGEAHPSKFYGETAETIIAFYNWVVEEKILESSPYQIYEINKNLSKMGRNYAAKCAIDVALYDLLGKINNLPTYKYLGLSKDIPKTSYTIDISNIDLTLQKTGDALMAGHEIFKVKLGTSLDEETIFSIHQAAPDVTIRVDANAAWDLKRALKMVKYLEQFNIEFIEQPLAQNNLADLEKLRTATTIPIIVDESCITLNDVPKIAGIADGINIKLSKCGGITPALKMISAAQACNLKVMVGCFVETSIAISSAGLIASQADYVDLDGCLLLKKDPFNLVTYKKNHLILQDIPGIVPENIL